MLRPFYEATVTPPVLLPQGSYQQIVALCESIIAETESPDPYSAAIVLGAFRIILGLVTRYAGTGANRSDARVQQVLRIISERFTEPLETRELALEPIESIRPATRSALAKSCPACAPHQSCCIPRAQVPWTDGIRNTELLSERIHR